MRTLTRSTGVPEDLRKSAKPRGSIKSWRLIRLDEDISIARRAGFSTRDPVKGGHESNTKSINLAAMLAQNLPGFGWSHGHRSLARTG